MKMKGKVVGETKVHNSDGMAIRITLENGVYLEFTNLSELVFRDLMRFAELGKKIEITLKEERR
jgi:nitrogen fixation protein